MPFLTMIATIPFLAIAYRKNNSHEKMYLGKLMLLWFLCQLYISVNDTYKIPIGIIAAFIIAYGDKTNKKSKILAFAVGCIGFVCSNIVYVLYNLN
jgi:branched-subunit amino acid transport protein AzlD